MRENLSGAGAARVLCLLLCLPGCNAVFGIREGIEDGAGAAGGTGGDGTGGSGTGGTGGAAACSSTCADSDYGQPDGPCAPDILYESLGNLDENLEGTGVVVDEARDRVIWAKGDGAAIMATPRSGGDSLVLADVPVQPGAHYPWSLAVSGKYLHWTTFYDGSVGRLDLEKVGSAPELAATAPGMGLRMPLSVHGGRVYFFTMVSTEQVANPWCHGPESGKPPATCTMQPWRAALDGAGETATEVGPAHDGGIGGGAADETRVYWVECNPSVTGGRIRYVELGGPEPQTLLEFGGGCGEGLAVEPGPDGLVYWATNSTISRADKAGQNLGALVAANSPSHILVDDTHVYWVESSGLGEPEDDGAIYRLAKTGGDTVKVATAHEPGGIAQDACSIYWTSTFLQNQPGGHIELKRISK